MKTCISLALVVTAVSLCTYRRHPCCWLNQLRDNKNSRSFRGNKNSRSNQHKSRPRAIQPCRSIRIPPKAIQVARESTG